MKLICKKYRWNNNVNLSDVNIFSTEDKTLIEQIDLKYYLIKGTLSDIEYTFEGINSVTNGLEIKMSNVNFQCKNEIYDRTSLQNFFELYKNDARVKFVFEYYNNDNEFKFSGLIYKNNVEFSERANDILDITVVSEEKEFIDYYSNQDLRYPINPASWNSAQNLFGIDAGQPAAVRNVLFLELSTLLQINFLTVQLGGCPANHYISRTPFTFNPFTAGVLFMDHTDLFHIRTGYDCFINDGVKMYDYFSSLLMSKGWIWYFYLGKLYIRERGGNGLSNETIDYRTEVLSHSVSSDLLEMQVDSVTIFNGNYFDSGSINGALKINKSGGGKIDLSGEIRHVYSNSSYWERARPFKTLQYIPPIGTISSRYLIQVNNLDYSRYTADTDRDLIRQRIVLSGSNPYSSTNTDTSFSRQRTLLIEPVINSQANAGGFDLNNARAATGAYYGGGNFYFASTTITDSHILYRGNPASSMIRYDTATAQMVSYEVDCMQNNFKNNFKKFVKGANPILFDIEVKGLITDPFQNITINNYPFESSVSSKTFAIQRLSFNDLTKTSKLTLQML